MTFKYFSECSGQAVELSNIQHDGHVSAAPKHFSGKCEACGERHAASRAIQYKAQPSRHECNAKCMNGSMRGVCECGCGGKNHGVGGLIGKPLASLGYQKALVLEAWDRLFGPEERQEKRDQRWTAADVNRKAKGQL